MNTSTTLAIRLLPLEVADGPHNMAADEVLIESAAARQIASLRFYGWTTATVSLGYFQAAAARLADRRLASLPWVRRPTGGATLVHDRELTYALALPPGAPWQAGVPWMLRMHRIIMAALTSLGAGAGLQLAKQSTAASEVLCFQQATPGDLLCHGVKIVGSAQRKHRQCLLQHGGMLLAQSQHTPALPGLKELAGAAISPLAMAEAVAAAFMRETRWELATGTWTEAEKLRIKQLAAEKYVSAAWNEKR